MIRDDGSKSAVKFFKTAHAGIATFANRKIGKGELIFEERPIVYATTSTQDDEEILKETSDFDREVIFSFQDAEVTNPKTIKHFSGILTTNVFEIGAWAGLFPTLTRINHSCRPNAHFNWDVLRSVMQVHAQEDIEEGQEINVSYIYMGWSTPVRRRELEESHRFTCTCQLCSRTNRTEVALSDFRRSRIEPLKKKAKRMEKIDLQLALSKLEAVFEIFQQEDLMYFAAYTGEISELYLKVLINFPRYKRNVKLISDYAKYTLGNYTIAFGKEFVDRQYHWVKSFL